MFFPRCLVFLAILGTMASCSKGPSVTPTPMHADAALLAAVKALGEQKPEKALKLLAPALAMQPDDPETLNVKGAILTKLKDYDGAQV